MQAFLYPYHNESKKPLSFLIMVYLEQLCVLGKNCVIEEEKSGGWLNNVLFIGSDFMPNADEQNKATTPTSRP